MAREPTTTTDSTSTDARTRATPQSQSPLRRTARITLRCLALGAVLVGGVGIGAAQGTDTSVNIDVFYNLTEVALTVARMAGPFLVALGGVGVCYERISIDQKKGWKTIVSGILLTLFAFGYGVLIGLIKFVANGVG